MRSDDLTAADMNSPSCGCVDGAMDCSRLQLTLQRAQCARRNAPPNVWRAHSWPFRPHPKPSSSNSISSTPSMQAAAGRQASRKANLAIAGLLTVFVGGTYFNILSRVSRDDLEAELQRELEEEARKQAKQAAAQQSA